jgi:hypothetical protein
VLTKYIPVRGAKQAADSRIFQQQQKTARRGGSWQPVGSTLQE